METNGTIAQEPVLVAKLTKTWGKIIINDSPVWFAMSATYRSEMKVKEELTKCGIRCFVPMKLIVTESHGRRTKKYVPAVSNLIFVYAAPSKLQEVKRSIPRLQFKTMTNDGQNIPIRVPDKQMNDFITVSTAFIDDAVFYRPEELKLEKGQHVRLIGGGEMFEGVEGILVKVKGFRSKKFVVQVPGLACATVVVSPDLVEVIG